MLEREAAAPGILFPAQFSPLKGVSHLTGQIDAGAAFDHLLIVLMRLFQSQPQIGAASAEATDVDAHADLRPLALQSPGDLRQSLRGNLNHVPTSAQ